MNTEDLKTLKLFCCKQGVREPFTATRLKAGRNSEVFRIDNAEGQWIVKNYFRHERDIRDRLETEYSFLQLMQDENVERVATPLGVDYERGLAIYSFLLGQRPTRITSDSIEQAVSFIVHINRAVAHRPQLIMKQAADACFSWSDHIALTDRRISRLLAIAPSTELEHETYALVNEQFVPFWSTLKARIIDTVPLAIYEKPLNLKDRVLSPSDFGFHNVLDSAGTLYFVDFEYAGWDDAAKLICDFICQPDLPVSEAQAIEFMNNLSTQLPNAETIKHRVATLLPVHRLKWCCILLNEFCADDRLRRAHAGLLSDDVLAVQLEKTRNYFFKHLISNNRK